MIQFNIIGKGFLEMDETGGLSFKQSNAYWRFADISLGRSVEFSIPGSRHNRALLEYGDDADEFGDMLRATYPCQMIADTEAVFGTISVTAYESEEFKCCFYIGNTEKLDALKNRRLADMPITTDPIQWATTTPVGTETSDGLIALLDYEHPIPASPWQLLPSINANVYARLILSQLGISCYGIDPDVWLCAGSINGGGEDAVTLTQTALNNASVTQTQNYFSVEDIVLKVYDYSNPFNFLPEIYSNNAKGFKAIQDIELTFQDPMPNNTYLIKWHRRPKKCVTMGGKPRRSWYEFHTLDGRTVTLSKGDIVFFATVPAPDYYTSEIVGFLSSQYALVSINVNVKRTTQLSLGENWYLQNNAPDMTVWEFLRSVAVAIGKEVVVTVNPNNIDDVTVSIVEGYYGIKHIRPIENVISTDTIKRRVEAWGDETATAVIEFDSEDYVQERLQTFYEVQTTQVKETASHVAKFSEGNQGKVLISIRDNDDGEFSAKKWTIARRVDNGLYRIEAPFPFGYDDIATASTCVTMKIAATIEDFLSLQPPTTFLWRGLGYIWTDATWSQNVMSLTLQKIAQPHAEIVE